MTGEEQRAGELIAEMDGRLAAVQEAVADQEPVRVLCRRAGVDDAAELYSIAQVLMEKIKTFIRKDL